VELIPIVRTNRDKKRFKRALGIYRQTIAGAQTPERQILYWIDHGKQYFHHFRCFALERDGDVLGYLEYRYFLKEHIFFFKHLSICKKLSGLVVSELIDGIQDYLARHYPPRFTVTFEVAHRPIAGQWCSDTELIRYLTELGFRSLDFPYRYPVWQSYRGAMIYPADLMVIMPDQGATASASEIRTVLRCIYRKHYLHWHRPFLQPQQFSLWKDMVNELYSEQVTTISDDDTFGTSGDAKRAKRRRFINQLPPVWEVVSKFFAPKMLRLIAIIAVLLFANWCLNRMGSGLLFIPFILSAALLYCLAENTKETRKLFVVIISRLKIGRPRSS
jgi:hypothetical protein